MLIYSILAFWFVQGTTQQAAVGRITKVDKTRNVIEVSLGNDMKESPSVIVVGDGPSITIPTRAPAPRNTSGRLPPIDPRDPGSARIPVDRLPRSEPSIPDRSPGSSRESFAKKIVYISDKTVCRTGEKPFLCSELKVTDVVRITGEEKRDINQGWVLHAAEIVRNR